MEYKLNDKQVNPRICAGPVLVKRKMKSKEEKILIGYLARRKRGNKL